jgi:hypothetical protein
MAIWLSHRWLGSRAVSFRLYERKYLSEPPRRAMGQMDQNCAKNRPEIALNETKRLEERFRQSRPMLAV